MSSAVAFQMNGVLVPVLGPGRDSGVEIGDAGEHAAAQAFVGEFFGPPFDQIDP